MKCPMKFNNPCCDVTDECDPECAWSVAVEGVGDCSMDGRKVCAIAILARDSIDGNYTLYVTSISPKKGVSND